MAATVGAADLGQAQQPTLDLPTLAPAALVVSIPTVAPTQCGLSETPEAGRLRQGAVSATALTSPVLPLPPHAGVPVAKDAADPLSQPADRASPPATPVDLFLPASEPDAATSRVAAAVLKPALPIFEALSLLQWTRDHASGGSASPGATVEHIIHAADNAATASANEPVSASAALITAMPSAFSPPPVPMSAPIATVTDVSATIGAMIVDMGVGGQWIDRLARDIAGFAANGAQGGFRIEVGTLGPVEVAIGRTGEGAIISLRVANDAAEAALRQDGDRLRQDAALSAVRIADLRIERAPLADAPRGETMGREGGQQQGAAGLQGSAMGQQGAGQSASRQPHGNSPLSAKAGGERAVLDDGQAHDRAGEAPRARFA